MGIPVPRVFTTGEVAADRVRRWEQHNAASLVALACEAPTDREFEALEVNLELPGVHLARVRGSRHTVGRDGGLVESNPADAIAVYAALHGDAVFEHAGRRRVLHPGDVLVCDADRPFGRGFGHGLDELAVKVPRATFALTTGREMLDGPVVISGDRNGRALARLVGRTLRPSGAVPADEQAVLELVAVLATGGRVETALAHRVAARGYIEEHLGDPTLSAASVAAATGISERTLSRVFAASGTSVPQHILARRLDAAYALLASGAAGRTTDAADRLGFASAAYFSQSFRRRFGITAGEVRRGLAG
jgi:AraC-like DNA-binding protein